MAEQLCAAGSRVGSIDGDVGPELSQATVKSLDKEKVGELGVRVVAQAGVSLGTLEQVIANIGRGVHGTRGKDNDATLGGRVEEGQQAESQGIMTQMVLLSMGVRVLIRLDMFIIVIVRLKRPDFWVSFSFFA